MRSKLLAATAAVSLLTATSAAAAVQAAAPAPSAVAATDRAGAPLQDGSELRGATTWIIALIVIALLIWAGTELLDDKEDEAPPPTSP